jgi:transcription antitermination factor NusG
MTSLVPFNWYALRVRSRHEKQVSTALRLKGYEEFLPLYRSRNKWADRYKTVDLPLLSGYVFCRIDPLDMLPALVTPGVIDTVRVGKKAAVLEEAEIARLQSLASSALNFQPWPYLQVGDRVRVRDGPMSGIEGIMIQMKNSLRVVLSVDLLQRSVAIEIDRDWVVPCNAQRRPPQVFGGDPLLNRKFA